MSSQKTTLFQRVFYFFPFRLVIIHLKFNQILLLFWLFMAACISGELFTGYGIRNLFLYPEYLGRIDFTSHAIVGFSIGGIVMAFNISGYILHGAKFPLLATLRKPFTKYTLNNFIVPLAFIVFYLVELSRYQYYQELETPGKIALHAAGFSTGLILFIFFTITYFFNTNKGLRKLFGDNILTSGTPRKRAYYRPVKNIFSRPEKWYSFLTRANEDKVHTYLTSPYKISYARDIKHYDKQMLRTVFAQNHINASLFEFATIITIIFISLFRENPVFQIPAAASITLILTVILMLSSAVYSWLHGWSIAVFILLLIGYNYISKHPDYSFKSYAYGLNYRSDPTSYNSVIADYFVFDSAKYTNEKALGDSILRNRIKLLSSDRKEKPKLIFLNCSGGGLRATMWSFRVMQHLDSLTSGRFAEQTQLISGSSGGMLGAAYFRELYLRKTHGDPIHLQDSIYTQKIGSEALNNVALSLALHDWIIRFRKFEYAGEKYTKDRGYSFERQFSNNTDNILEKKIADYRNAERSARIPEMILSPTVANDGRRMLISTRPVSYLTQPYFLGGLKTRTLVEAMDYRSLLPNNNPDSLSFITALRMNATFFYVLPNVVLPTQPEVEVMDAGVRDNNGMMNTMRFLNAHRDIIEEETSGVVIIQIHDRYSDPVIKNVPEYSFFKTFTRPLQAVYGNYLHIQNYAQDEMLMHMSKSFKNKISVVRYNLLTTADEDISLSWRLTGKEKRRIENAVYRRDNRLSDSLLLQTLK